MFCIPEILGSESGIMLQNGGKTLSDAGKWSSCRYIMPCYLIISLKKGAQIKSYLISHALITAGFKM